MISHAHRAVDSTSAAEFAALLGRLQRGLRRRARAALPGPALPQSHVVVLRLLAARPDLRVQEVATALNLAPNTTSTLVQQLMRLGYVERTVDDRDRRVARLALTGAAGERMAHWRDARTVALGAAFAALDDADRAKLQAAHLEGTDA
jgi:DNA-binding MarR family transcriptional regulator